MRIVRSECVRARGGVMVLSACALLFSAAGAAAQPDIVLQASSPSARVGGWTVTNDSAAFNGAKIRNADRGASKRSTALANPASYFELTFNATAGVPYRLWLRGKADGNEWDNDSVFVQFSGAVNASRGAVYRIGTTAATEVNLEECKGCGLRGWKWQDNGWGNGVLGPVIYFATTGRQTLRVQSREDGISIDRIILSPATHLRTRPTAAPPAPDNGSDDEEGDDDDGGAAVPVSTGGQLRVLDWNIHHGVGTDGSYNISRIADWIARSGANVVSLNEVERYTGWGNEDQPARFASLLRSRTGRTWHYKFAERYGGTKGQGNLLLTTFPIESSDGYELSYGRSVARLAILVNGIRVNVYSTHLDADSSSRRATQMRELVAWADNYPEQRILAGDFNAWPGAAEISVMKHGHHDSWALAQSLDVDVAYSGNAAGNTRRSRIDYVFFSKGASRLRLRQTRVFDVRDSRGVMPSDHRPLMATYEVR